MKLQSRFMLYFGAIVTTLMALVLLLVEHTLSTTMLRQTQMRGVAIANSIAAVVKTDLLNYDYVSLQQAAETANLEEGVAYVIIVNKENIVAGYSGHPEKQGRILSDAVSARINQSDGFLIQRVEPDGTTLVSVPHLDVASPVHVDGAQERWGTVRIGLSLAPLHRTLAQTRFALLVLGVAAVLIVLISARTLSRHITQPLEGLAEATAIVATGDLDYHVSENLVGELGDLARSFNKMTIDLKHSRDAIRYQNQHLENMVRLRTAALQDKAAELEKANAELKELDRLKGDFLSNVSHELRTPLTSIRSFTEIMLDTEQPISADEQGEFLQIVQEQACRLTRLISDLLDLSKIEAGEFQCQIVPMQFHRVADVCVETLRGIAGEKNIVLRNHLRADLPAVLADVDRANQVLTNLVDNALKFTPAGGTITISASRSPARRTSQRHYSTPLQGMEATGPAAAEYLIISVEDSGIGIRPEDQQRIFDKFGQVGNVLTDKPQGTGLGLAISGNIVLHHGGALWVESAPNEGAVFSFSLPLADPSVASQATPAGTPTVAGRQSTASDYIVDVLRRTSPGKQILVVDDEPAIVAVLTELLQPLGYRTIGCQSGSEAVARAREVQPDAIILDIMMPEINGYDVLRLLKSDPSTSDIPVIVLSVLEDKQKAFELGAAEYVRKPFEKRELLYNVRALA